MGCDRPWRLSTWDRFVVPRPYSRARGVISPAIRLPRDLDRDGIEHYRQRIEALLERLTQEAEAWAEAGTSKLNEHTPHCGPAPLGGTLEALEEWWYGAAPSNVSAKLPRHARILRAA
jgi:hypothetical protein